MQTLVLGMHRSGTSCVTQLLCEMVAYFGPAGSEIPANDENPQGFFERKDVLVFNDMILHALGGDWWCPPRIDSTVPEALQRRATAHWRPILDDLDQHAFWVLKDPRLCLTWPLIMETLRRPLVVVVHRHPLDVAESLRKRNGLPAEVGLAIWNVYQASALRATVGAPWLAVDYDRLVENAQEQTRRLAGALRDAGVHTVREPGASRLSDIVLPQLRRNRSAAAPLPATTAALLELTSNRRFTAADIPDVSADFGLLHDYDATQALHGVQRSFLDLRQRLRRRPDGREPAAPRGRPAPPLVDVVIPAYQDGGNIGLIIDNLKHQTYGNIRVTIIDDCSPDDTVAAARSAIGDDNRFTVLQNAANLGLVRNFQKCLESGTADYVFFKSSNDLVAPDFIERAMTIHVSHPHAALVYGRSAIFNESRVISAFPDWTHFDTSDVFAPDKPEARAQAAAKVMQFYGQASPLWGIYRRSVLQRCLPYDYHYGSDHVLVCEVSLYGSIHCMQDTYMFRQNHPYHQLQRLSDLHSLDLPRGIDRGSIFADHRRFLSFTALIYTHCRMFEQADIPDTLRPSLQEAARQILYERYRQVIDAECRNYLGLVASLVQNRTYRSLPAATRNTLNHKIAHNVSIITLAKPDSARDVVHLCQALHAA